MSITLTDQRVTDAMKAWESIRPDGDKIVSFFNYGNNFTFDVPEDYLSGSPFLHAYPGIDKEELCLFLIPSEYDVPGIKDFAQYVIRVPLNKGYGNIILTPSEALYRIDKWNNEYTTWIPKQVSMPVGIFQAFSIPKGDFHEKNTLIYMALRDNGELGQPYDADLVIANVPDSGAAILFDDDVASVPPFQPSPAAASNSFYLLSLT